VTSNRLVLVNDLKGKKNEKKSEEYIAGIYGKPTPRSQAKAKQNDT
jgi:hypothetical protein